MISGHVSCTHTWLLCTLKKSSPNAPSIALFHLSLRAYPPTHLLHIALENSCFFNFSSILFANFFLCQFYLVFLCSSLNNFWIKKNVLINNLLTLTDSHLDNLCQLPRSWLAAHHYRICQRRSSVNICLLFDCFWKWIRRQRREERKGEENEAV